jgi:aminoglycoside 3-N-acetyltransferase
VVGARDVAAAARRLGLAEAPICVHSSLRSFGPVEGGADAVIDGLLAAGCTVMVPTFSYGEVEPPVGQRPARNGLDPHARWRRPARPFAVESNDLDASMGTLPRVLLRRPGRVRGDNPLNSFAAVGPSAEALIKPQQPLDVYAPLRVLGELGGFVVLMGVGLDSMTLIHLAEQVAGRVLFRRWAVRSGGEVVECEVGSCSRGFPKLEPAVHLLAREARVGWSLWRAFPAAATVAAAADAIHRNPRVTWCERPGCNRCEDAIAGGPLLDERS